MSGSKIILTAFVGDIHGRFHRIRDWLANLEGVRGRPVTATFAVGDVEAFSSAEDHRRKAAKRMLPAEFADYATGRCRMDRTIHFIGGNNEDFEALYPMPQGGALAADFQYLGRYGSRTIEGTRVAWLSGIYAPRYIDKPLPEPTTVELARQLGYFREEEVRSLESVSNPDVMLVHEWPRGVISRHTALGRGVTRDLKAYRTPWIGNHVTRTLVDIVRPQWLFCGHSHVAFATRLDHSSTSHTKVVCLDQAAKPDGALFWIEWERGVAVRGGWGTGENVVWRVGEPWDERATPAAGNADRYYRRPVPVPGATAPHPRLPEDVEVTEAEARDLSEPDPPSETDAAKTGTGRAG